MNILRRESYKVTKRRVSGNLVMESRIRELCFELMNTRDADRMEQIGDELRDAIHACIERLREQIVVLPCVPTEPTTFVKTSKAA